MRFCLLGPVEVIGASGPLPLGGPKQRGVLALLALSANRVVPVDRLIAGVWGDDANERAGSTLQVYVSNLRRILRSGEQAGESPVTILAQRPGYSLRVRPEDVDILEFTHLVDEARADLAANRTEEGAALLHQALALWRGEALADLTGEPFSQPEVVRLEQARIAAIEERIETDLLRGRHREILVELEGLVADHPLRERLWGQLIVALYRADRQADALAAYRRVRALLADELGIDPGPTLRELEQAVLRQDLPVAVPSARTTSLTAPVRLPTPIGRTFGREDEVAALAAQLRVDDSRLLTLTGPGGSGKTRLLTGLAHATADEFAGGVFFVDLTTVTEASQVMPAIVSVLGGAEANAEPLAAAIDVLAGRHALLALDNFEHVLGAASEISALLRAAPRLQVVVSSQAALRVAGEVEHRVHGLATPAAGASLEEIGATGAVRLFVARAVATRPGFALGPDNAETVAEICRRLEGLPLALELAVSRLRLLSLDAIHDRLDDSLNLLNSGSRDAPTRQRTLRAAIRWSVDLLDEEARDVLARLSVFAGEFDLAAAVSVCGPSGEDGLQTLLENSLLHSDGSAGEPRFRMLEAVRQYARDAMSTPAQTQAATSRLVTHYMDAAASVHALADGPRVAEAAAIVAGQQANFRLAFQAALQSGDTGAAPRLAIALAPVWLVLGRAGEARQNLADVLAVGAHPEYDAAAYLAAGRLAYQQNDLDASRRLLEAALADEPGRTPLPSGDVALARCLLAAVAASFGEAGARAAAESALRAAEVDGGYVGRVVGRSILAITAARQGDFALEKELYEQRLVLARDHDDRVRVADTLTVLGEIAFDEKDYPTARALLRESLALVDGHSSPESRDALTMLGRIAVADRDPERAVALLDEALHRSVDNGQPAALALCVRVHAAAAVLQGDAARAARLFGAGDALQPTLVPVNAGVEGDLAERRAECRAALGDLAFEQEYSWGASLDPAGAIVLAGRPAIPRITVGGGDHG